MSNVPTVALTIRACQWSDGDILYKVKIISEKTRERLMEKYYSGNLLESKAAIHGTCVKFFTDDATMMDMWKLNFEQMPDWIRPHARIFSVKDGKKLSVLYEPESKTVFVRNCDYYGWVKSIALGLVADFMEDFVSEHRRYSVHGSFVDCNGKGTAIIGPPGSGKTTLTYGLLMDQNCSFLTDDWFFVRCFEDHTAAYSAEKNSYVRRDLAENWPQLKKKLADVKFDNRERAVIEVRQFFGSGRIRQESNLNLIVLLTREKGKPVLRKLGRGAAIRFMLKNDFCNPHQLLRTGKKTEKRRKFFMEIFSRVPVYLLNTVEAPSQSLARLRELISRHS